MPYANPEAQRAFQRGWIAERRGEFFAGKTCEWCGSSDELHLHHRDPNRKVSHRIWSWAVARIEAEAAKCDVICGACHRKAHADARRLEAELRNPHGTSQRYRLGCRCDDCRAGKADDARARSRRAAA